MENMDTLYCPDAMPTFFGLLDFSIAPNLLFYAYIPIIIIMLLMSLVVMRSDSNSLQSKLFAAIALSFTGWVVLVILQWIAAPVSLVLFSWQLLVLFEIATYAFTTFFLYVFLFRKKIPRRFVSVVIILSLPVILLLPTNLNISGFDIMLCEGAQHDVVFYYSYLFDISMILMAIYFGTMSFIKRDQLATSNRRIVAASLGTVVFMNVFLVSTALGDFIFDGYEVELTGPIGIVVFLSFMLYLMVRYKAFGSKVIATEAFVGVLVVLIFAMFFIQKIEMVRIITGVTLVLALILGFLLVLSVRREVKQREEIEKLAEQLKKANKRLKVLDQLKSEFVSIASHQLRSPLTSIRGYASMLLEGSFGKLTDKGREAIERISESSRLMAMSVEDYLNVSRIEAGRMKYELSDFNLKEMAEHIVDDLRPMAIKKGLVLTSKTSEVTSRGIVNADIGKAQQIIHNLVDNALKYTPKGTVTVRVRDDKKKKRIFIDIIDSGVGMDKDAIEEVFEKFIRARNANKVNVSGTGLGLYVAKKMAEGMGGTITADSEGEGKGSVFTFELPLAM